MSLTVAMLDALDKPTHFVDVPSLLRPDGRADLKGIRQHLRERGLPHQRIRVTPRHAQRAPGESSMVLVA